MVRRKRPASRGFVNNIILESLYDGDKYGYEIIKEVEKKSNGKVVLKQPSLYSSLKRFEQKGLISSYWGDSDIGGRRHYYTITELGKKFFLSNGKMNIDDLEDLKVVTSDEYVQDEVPSDLLSTINQLDTNDEIIDKSDEPLEEILDDMLFTDLPEYDIDETNDDADDLSDTYIRTLHEENVEKPEEEVEQEKENEFLLSDEHVFGAKDVYRQNDLFEQAEVTTLPMTEEDIDVEALNSVRKTEKAEEKITEEQTAQEDTHTAHANIPLIKEHEISFDNWEDLKRKTIQNKRSFADSYDTSPTISPTTFILGENKPVKTSEINEVRTEVIFKDDLPKVDIDDINLTLQVKKNNKTEKVFDESVTTLETRATPRKEDRSYINNSRDIDYKSILGELYTGEDEKAEHSENEYMDLVKQQLEEHQYTNIEPVIDISPKAKHTIEALVEEGFKYKPYNTNVKKPNFDFVKVNKLNLVCGFIIAMIIALQTGVLKLILDAKNMLNISDTPLYYVGFGIAGFILCYHFIVYISNPNKRTNKQDNIKISLWFGLLGFVSITILTLAVNLILGCTMANIQSLYMTSLILPVLISTNFMISPIVRHILLGSRTFYK